LSSSKITAEDMLEEISDELIIFLKQGSIRVDSFLKKVDLNINNFEQLLRIHFLLKEEVKEFIEDLPHSIRNIKTSTQKINREVKGEIRGRIDWQATISNKSKKAYTNSNTFVCQQVNKDFNIKENLVLKKFLNIINNIIYNDLNSSWNNYSWLSDWFNNDGLFKKFEQIMSKNVYLKRIGLDNKIISERMIADSKKSRNSLYRRAAELLEFYLDYIENNSWKDKNKSNKEIIKLLRNSFIQPEKDSVLFELYWVIKLIRANANGYKLNLLDGNSNLTAEWFKGNYKYSLYHDSTASKELNWKVKLSEVENTSNSYLKRKALSYKKAKGISKIINLKIDDNYWSGRPDIIIEIRNRSDNSLKKIVLAEVKYTKRHETAKNGLKELLDYIYLIKDVNNQYFDLNQDEIEIEGLLLVDKITSKNGSFKALKIKKIQNNYTSEEFKDCSIIL
jgi:hypothetical protein